MLHEALKNMHLCNYGTLLVLIDAVKRPFQNTEFNVNVADCDGNTPFHLAVTSLYKAMHKVNEIYLFTNFLEVLLDGGAHQHFVNHHGKTAMDLAKTNEACNILWDKRKLELKCICARAVKRLGLSYSGVVPKIVEKFISIH